MGGGESNSTKDRVQVATPNSKLPQPVNTTSQFSIHRRSVINTLINNQKRLTGEVGGGGNDKKGGRGPKRQNWIHT